MKRLSWLVLVVTAILTRAAYGQAYDPKTGDPPPGQHLQDTYNDWDVIPALDGKGVKGIVRLLCYHDEYDEVFIRVKGLVPLGKYTAWLVNEESDDPTIERAGIARHWEGEKASQFWFKAERDGRGFYHGWLQHCPLGKWKYFEVRYHANGNEKDMADSVVVFRARIRPR